MKYSKHDREMAAVRCQVIADSWMRRGPHPDAYEEFHVSSAAKELSTSAYEMAYNDPVDWTMSAMEEVAVNWAGAEALIRDGWSP